MRLRTIAVVMLWAALASADKEPDAAKKPKDGPFAIGAMAGVGFPRPLSVEAMIVLGRTVGLGAEYSVLPPITVAGVNASASAIAGDVRIFPFRGAFFLGVRGGLQRLDGGMGSQSLLAETWYVNPRIGFMWTWRPGLAIGMEAGVQLPVSTRTQMPALATIEVTNVTNTLASSALPTIDLLRIGLML
jgi:hypothetical protein